MKKLYTLIVCIMSVITAMAQQTTSKETINGTLNVSMNGYPLVENEAKTVELISTGENTCTFRLLDFSIDLGSGPVSLGDIEVPDVKVTTTDGVKKYVGEVKNMSLAGGEITADVNLDGTIDAEGNANMLIKVVSAGMPIDVTFTGKLQQKETINGTLNVSMNGYPLVENEAKTVELISTGENTCTFRLLDFSIDLGSGPVSLGDIEVPDVKVTTTDGVKKYVGEVKNMSLAGGEITADVNLDGTIDAEGNANMLIKVLSAGMPIDVTFTGKVMAGIADVVVDENAPVEYYNLQGVRVANPDNGIYIRRQGNKVTKIFVK